MAKSKWNTNKWFNKKKKQFMRAGVLVAQNLDSEAVATTSGKRGIFLKAVDNAVLIKNYATDVFFSADDLVVQLGNIVNYYKYVHFGTEEGKPGKTQPRPIITVVNDREAKNNLKLVQKVLNNG